MKKCQSPRMSACCPLDVRLMSAFKADIKRTSSIYEPAKNAPGYPMRCINAGSLQRSFNIFLILIYNK